MRRLLWMALLGGACSAPEPGVAYGDQRLEVFDLHLHPGEWEDIPPSTADVIAARFPFPLGLNAERTSVGVLSPDSLVEQLDEGGVAKAGLFAVYAPRSVGVSTNELVISYLDEHPDRFFGFASLQVDDWGSKRDSELQRLRDALAHPLMVGVKLAHAHQRFRMDDPVYYGIYEIAAEFGAPVYLHTGTSPFPGTQTAPPYCDPAYLEDAISKHPSTTFILGHLGHDATNRDIGFLDSALTLAERYPNVYLEPSALAKLGPEVEEDNMYVAFQRIEAKGLWDRVIYGSDGPQSPGFVGEHKERTATVLRALDVPVEKADAVFHGNLQRVLGSVP